MPDDRTHIPTAILTDSAAGMPAELLAQHGIHVAPMTIRVGDEELPDVPGTEYGCIYDVVRRNPDVPVAVSAPLPHVWRDAVVSIATTTGITSVLIITMSAHFSASYDAARVGAQWASSQLPDMRVKVIDSDTFAGAQALVCIAAADVANRGADIEAVSEAATDASSRAHAVTMLGTLDQIHRITRLPRYALATARRLPIKPVVSYRASRWDIIARPLTRRSGINKVITAANIGLTTSECEATRAIVMHVQCEQDASRIADALTAANRTADITQCELHPFAGVPAGTGTVGVAWL